MIEGRAGAKSSNLLVLLVCLFLGGVVYLEWWADAVPPRTPPPGDSAAAAARSALPPEPGFTPPPYESFAEAAERPLFAPSRRPPADTEAAIAEASPQMLEFGFELVGVLISPQERLALVRQGGVPDLQRVGVGRSLNGWLVEAIEPDRVVFRAGETVRELMLRDDAPLPAPAEQRRRAGEERRQPDAPPAATEDDQESPEPAEPSEEGGRLGRAEAAATASTERRRN